MIIFSHLLRKYGDKMKVKICGITNKEDALKAVFLGADAIGLLIGLNPKNRDFISSEAAKNIVYSLPPFCSSVFVALMNDPNEIIAITNYVNNTTVQLQSEITISEIRKIRDALSKTKILKCVHVIDRSSIDKAMEYEPYVDGILLDSYNQKTNQVGGTGLTHDWNISKEIINKCSKPVIIAGGLNPDNVEEVKLKLQPYGVDVNSGLKDQFGNKDYDKMERFIRICKR